MVIPGILIVVGCMLGGFLMAGGNPAALIQPAEFVTILGMAFGAMVISSPMKVLKQCVSKTLGSLKGSPFNKQAYLDLLTMLFRLFSLARKNGLLALEPHLSDPHKSDIISKYHSVLHHKACFDLLSETMRMMVDGSIQPEEIAPMMDNSIETHEAEGHMPVNVMRAVGDGLPGIGIVGAVLGIIITMSHIDGKPEVIGHHVAAALVGTFLGVFSAYGLINPVVASISQVESEETKYMAVIKTALTAYFTGSSPAVAVEFARRAIFSFDRPTAQELEAACKNAG